MNILRYYHGQETCGRNSTLSFLFSRFLLVVLLSIFYFLFSHSAYAQADLHFSPANGTYRIGELFSVLVNVNTAGKSINAASALINFDNQRLEVVSVGYSSSIFTLWTQEPSYSNAAGAISFSGGLPSPGFVGSSGAVIRVTFKPKMNGQAPIIFTSGAVLANDGFGTNIISNLRGALFNILPSTALTAAPEKKPEPKPAPESPRVISAEKPVEPPLPNSKTLKFLWTMLSRAMMAPKESQG